MRRNDGARLWSDYDRPGRETRDGFEDEIFRLNVASNQGRLLFEEIRYAF